MRLPLYPALLLLVYCVFTTKGNSNASEQDSDKPPVPVHNGPHTIPPSKPTPKITPEALVSPGGPGIEGPKKAPEPYTHTDKLVAHPSKPVPKNTPDAPHPDQAREIPGPPGPPGGPGVGPKIGPQAHSESDLLIVPLHLGPHTIPPLEPVVPKVAPAVGPGGDPGAGASGKAGPIGPKAVREYKRRLIETQDIFSTPIKPGPKAGPKQGTSKPTSSPTGNFRRNFENEDKDETRSHVKRHRGRHAPQKLFNFFN